MSDSISASKINLTLPHGITNASLWFLRHAESDGNALGDNCPVMHNTPLTKLGFTQAENAFKYLQKSGVFIDKVYASPQIRAIQTAEAISNGFEVPLEIIPGFGERNWGIWKDLCWDEVSKKLEKFNLEERYTVIPENGESWQQMEVRLFSALESVISEIEINGENVLIVTHRGCLRAILPILAKAGHEAHADFSVSTGSLTKFDLQKRVFDGTIGLKPNEFV